MWGESGYAQHTPNPSPIFKFFRIALFCLSSTIPPQIIRQLVKYYISYFSHLLVRQLAFFNTFTPPFFPSSCSKNTMINPPLFISPSCSKSTMRNPPLFISPSCSKNTLRNPPLFISPSCSKNTLRNPPLFFQKPPPFVSPSLF